MRPGALGCLARIALALAAACGDDDGSGPGDGGSAGDGGMGAPGIAAPEIPWLAAGTPELALPVLTPCPSGWREVVDGDITVCDPLPETGAASCARGEAHFPGEPGCAAVGTACPSGEFADGLADDGSVVFVRAGATGGDGSRTSPFGRLADVAWGSLGAGRTVALARGTYDGTLPLRAGVRVVGTCAAETILAGLAGPFAGVVTVQSAGDPAVVTDVAFVGAPEAAANVTGAGRALELEGVVVESAAATAAILVADGGTVRATGLVVRGTRSADGVFGRAINAEGGSRVEVTRAVLDDNRNVAVFVGAAGTSVSLTDTWIRATAARADGRYGSGLDVEAGAQIELTRVLVEGNRTAGIFMSGASTATLVDVVFRGTQRQATGGDLGRGLDIESGAMLDASRVLVETSEDVQVFSGGDGASVSLTDVVVRDSAPRAGDDATGIGAELGGRIEGERIAVLRNVGGGAVALGAGSTISVSDLVIRDAQSIEGDGTFGRGISVQDGAILEATRAILERNSEVGVWVGGDGATATLTDAVVRDTRGRGLDGLNGRSIEASDGAHVSLTRALLERNHFTGVFASGAGSAASLTDVVVRDTLPQDFDMTGGRGLGVQLGASATVQRAIFERCIEIGILLAEPGTTVSLTDVVVSDTRSDAATGRLGHGIQAQDDAVLTGTRVLVDGAHGIGIGSVDGTTVTLEDSRVLNVSGWACSESSCADAPYGYAVAAIQGAIVMRRFEVARATQCGLIVSSAGDILLDTGEVHENLIGACIQVDGFDLSRIMRNVAYTDNESNLEATTLPVPEPIMTLPP